jgi:hypothetical protein
LSDPRSVVRSMLRLRVRRWLCALGDRRRLVPVRYQALQEGRGAVNSRAKRQAERSLRGYSPARVPRPALFHADVVKSRAWNRRNAPAAATSATVLDSATADLVTRPTCARIDRSTATCRRPRRRRRTRALMRTSTSGAGSSFASRAPTARRRHRRSTTRTTIARSMSSGSVARAICAGIEPKHARSRWPTAHPLAYRDAKGVPSPESNRGCHGLWIAGDSNPARVACKASLHPRAQPVAEAGVEPACTAYETVEEPFLNPAESTRARASDGLGCSVQENRSRRSAHA